MLHPFRIAVYLSLFGLLLGWALPAAAQAIDPVTGLPVGDPSAGPAPGTFTDADGNPIPADSLPDNSVEFDISDAFVQVFKAAKPFAWRAVDTGLYRFHVADPAFQGTLDRVTLGNLGQASHARAFGPRGTVGFDPAAYDAWAPYYTPPDSLRFWRANKPYTQARYQLASGVSQQLRVRHVRNLTPNLNASLDYKRVVSIGQSARQKTGIDDLAFSAWYRSSDRRYSAQLGLVYRAINAEENGGTAVGMDSVFDFTPRSGAPVRLDDAQHRHRGHTLFLEQAWHLGKRVARPGASPSAAGDAGRQTERPPTAPDSAVAAPNGLAPAADPPVAPMDSLTAVSDTLVTAPDTLLTEPGTPSPTEDIDSVDLALPAVDSAGLGKGPARTDSLAANAKKPKPKPEPIQPLWRAWHRFSWTTDDRGFSDNGPDSSYYGMALLEDLDTLQVNYGFQRFENRIGFGTFDPEWRARALADSTGYWSLGAELWHRFERIERTVGSRNQQDLLLDVQVRRFAGPAGGWFFQGHGRANVRGEYDLQAESGWRFGQHRVGVGLESTRRQPSEQEDFYIVQGLSGAFQWTNSFGGETRLVPELHYRNARSKTEWRLRAHLVDGYLYWNASGEPAQAGSGVTVLQAIVRQNFRFGHFRWDNSIAVQRSNAPQLNLPTYWGRHSLYFAGRIFGNALYAHIGGDIRYNTNYSADAWDPLSAAFHLQNTETLSFYPVVDAFLSGYVSRARFTIKGINLAQGLFQPGWYQTPGYPMPNRGILLQLDWVFWY